MNVLFIGNFFPRKLIATFTIDGKVGMANHNFEMSIINGLCLHNDIALKCITVPGVYSYPYNNTFFYTRRDFTNIRIHKYVL